MRIDGLSSSSLPLERSARPGSAVTPYRDVQREVEAVSYTHLRAHETTLHLVCRLLLEKKKSKRQR
ncbi:hypothetical protein KZ847_35520, partial [Pseudomonas aeruginosa]|nr:hypothetical protein [Pseudomonas aeruginosa]